MLLNPSDDEDVSVDPRLWPPIDGPLPPLKPGDVHLWSADLDASDALPLDLPLNQEEMSRAASFRFPRDAHRYRVGIWMRRAILGRYLGKDPARIGFRFGLYEKPELDRADAPDDLRFNTSHSGGIAVLALTLGADLGVDVEIPRPSTDLVQLARENFHPSEWRAIAAIEVEAEQAAAFYRCWVRKEALAKGAGLGLNLPLDRFAVETTQKKAPALTVLEPGLDLEPAWSLRDFSAPPALYAAVATKFPPRTVLGMSWRP